MSRWRSIVSISSRAPVDQVYERPALGVALEVGPEERAHLRGVVGREAGDVGSHDHARIVPERADGRQRLDLEDIGGDVGERAVGERARHRALVDDAAAGDVDERGPGLQRREGGGAEDAARLLGQRQRDDDVVGARERLLEAGRPHDLTGDLDLLTEALARSLSAAAHAGDPDAERLRGRGDGAAQPAEADDHHLRAVELHGHEALPALGRRRPLAPSLVREEIRHVIGEGQDHRHHVARDGPRRDAADRGHRDRAVGPERRAGDVIRTRGVELHPAQRRGLPRASGSTIRVQHLGAREQVARQFLHGGGRVLCDPMRGGGGSTSASQASSKRIVESTWIACRRAAHFSPDRAMPSTK